MKKVLFVFSISFIFIFSGCTTNGVPEYDGNSYQEIKTYEIGTVESVRSVVISDNGTGTFIGAIVGTVLGSMVGRAEGSALASLAGGLGGAYAGSQVMKANASELSVRVDDGRDVVVVVKGKGFHVGDRVKIIEDGNRVDQVYKID